LQLCFGAWYQSAPMLHCDGIIEYAVSAIDGGGQLELGPATHRFCCPGADA
jgi:hypothetical protein